MVYSGVEKAFCIELLIQGKAIITIQNAFRKQFHSHHAPSGSTIKHWLNAFREGYLESNDHKMEPHVIKVNENEAEAESGSEESGEGEKAESAVEDQDEEDEPETDGEANDPDYYIP